MTKYNYYCYYYTHSTAFFPGQPGKDGTRKVKPVWIKIRQDTTAFWDVVASAGPYGNDLHLAPDMLLTYMYSFWRVCCVNDNIL